VDTEGAGFVGTGRHHTPGAGVTANDNRLAAQLRIVALLDGGIEGVHIDVDNFALIQ
jgi:hypothetical protein